MKKGKRIFSEILEAALGVVYPRRCPVCREIAEPVGEMICPECRKKLSYIQGPVCFRCGKPLAAETKEYCADCGRKKRSFTQGTALLRYQTKDGLTRRILMELKYGNRREYADALAEEMALRQGEKIRRWQVQALVPVPVHPSRKRERGYNQAELLAKKLGERLEVPVSRCLNRRKKTMPQKELNERQRFENLLEAFEPSEEAKKWKRVALVDDIYTTGSTAEACTRALRKAGIEKVFLINAAIGSGTEETITDADNR